MKARFRMVNALPTGAIAYAVGLMLFLSPFAVAQPANRGYYWTQVTGVAPWTGRAYHAAVNFRGRMWVIGGDGDTGSGLVKDVWSSSDGRDWRFETGELGLTDWIGAGAIFVLGNELWTIDTWSASGAVWNSPDGVHWTQVANSVPCASRWGCLVTVFQNKLWALGGEDVTTPNYFDDVWNSSDGKDWTRVVQSAGWGGRCTHGAVFEGRLWVLGGTYTDQNGVTVWVHDASYSPDGVRWNGAPADGVGYQNTFVDFDNQLWDLDRGYDVYYPWDEEDFHASNEVWRSDDGATWRSVANGAWQPRLAQAALSFNGRIWVLGGMLEDHTFLNDVWCLTPVSLTIDTDQRTRYKLGEDLTLTLSAGEPDGVVGYQWWKNGEAIPGATSDIYHVDHFTEKDAGTYFCELTGDGWGSSNSVQIGVLEPNMPAAEPAALALAGMMVTGILVFWRRRWLSRPDLVIEPPNR